MKGDYAKAGELMHAVIPDLEEKVHDLEEQEQVQDQAQQQVQRKGRKGSSKKENAALFTALDPIYYRDRRATARPSS